MLCLVLLSANLACPGPVLPEVTLAGDDRQAEQALKMDTVGTHLTKRDLTLAFFVDSLGARPQLLARLGGELYSVG